MNFDYIRFIAVHKKLDKKFFENLERNDKKWVS